MAISAFSGGSTGFDGLFIIRPDGKVQFQSGIGNHGTHSVIDVHRVAADMIGVPWEQCEVVFGNTSKNLPWTCISAGSQTTHAMTRAAHAAATDAIKKLQEIAAKSLGGSPESYKVANGRVSDGGRSMTLAQAGAEGDRARRQIRRSRAAERRQQLHEEVGGGARRPGPDGASRRTRIRATVRRSRTSPASPKWKSTSRPASS